MDTPSTLTHIFIKLGGNYALVDATNMQPNPDYFTAVLWKRCAELILPSFNKLPLNLKGYKGYKLSHEIKRKGVRPLYPF